MALVCLVAINPSARAAAQNRAWQPEARDAAKPANARQKRSERNPEPTSAPKRAAARAANATNARTTATRESATNAKTAKRAESAGEAQRAKQHSSRCAAIVYQLLQEDVQSPWQELYGDEVRSLSKEDKAYLDENYRKIYTITQRNLRYPQEAGRLGLQGVNRVEFFLQPNGDITDLRITSSSGYEMFDKNSLRTIEISYKDYPRPKKPLKIIFYIHYKISY